MFAVTLYLKAQKSKIANRLMSFLIAFAVQFVFIVHIFNNEVRKKVCADKYNEDEAVKITPQGYAFKPSETKTSR